jgi:membrane protein DedA with SNARE-associated domain
MSIIWQVLGAVTAGSLLWLGAIFFLSLLGEFGLPATSPILEGMLVFTGFQIAQGGYFMAAIPFLAIVCTGRICGSTSAYQLSSSWGDTIITRFGKYIRITPENIMLARQKLGSLAVPSIIAARFTPGLSVLSSIICGISRIGHKHFFIGTIVHIMVWEAIFLALGALGGKVSARFFSPESYPTLLTIWIIAMVTLGIVIGYFVFRRIKNAR